MRDLYPERRRYNSGTVADQRHSRFTLTASGPAASEPYRRASAPQMRRIVLDAGIEQMILPDAVDAEVLPRIAFALEAGFLQETDGRHVGRDAGGFEPVQAQRHEAERQEAAQGRRHQAVARKGLAHPI